MPEQRLQKILSQAGVASRRKAEELITAGHVTVNGAVISELGSKADLDHDHIKVDGRLLHAPKFHTYIALNKPPGCVTTASDPEGRQTVMHLLRGVRERVFPVGRLDYQSEGLLLLTNDGEFAHRITAPASHVIKTYVVKANGPLTEDQETLFREGIPMHGRRTAPAEIKQIKKGINPWYEVRLAEGRQNQIRVMFKHFGRLVEKLRRVKIAFLELDLPAGRYRSLTPAEVERFRKLLKLDQEEIIPKEPGQEKPLDEKPRLELLPQKPRAENLRQAKPRREKPRQATPWRTKPREAKPGEAKPWQAKPREEMPRNAESQHAKPPQGKPSPPKPWQEKPREAKPWRANPREEMPRNAPPQHAKPPQGKPRSAKPWQEKPREAKPWRTNPREEMPRNAPPQHAKPPQGKPRSAKPSGEKPWRANSKPQHAKPHGATARPAKSRPAKPRHEKQR